MSSRRRQGPGGSRGLQNRSGRDPRPGGFDSRPPPPLDARPPSVDALARELADGGSALPPPLLVDAARAAIAAGDAASAADRAAAMQRAFLGPVINATGVLLHTNLGRAPTLPIDNPPYTNLELDLETGRRGARGAAIEQLVCALTGAEAATIVNNGAAAVMLVVAALADHGAVSVSRGELLEIGGGFRIPDIIEQSGARLVEVGTTNITRTPDYARACTADPAIALTLVVHQSNFRMQGHVRRAPTEDLAGLPVPLVVDLGSGLLDASTPWLPGGPPRWLQDEPAARQTLAAGAALVTFSGDKLLGGPQAGIIAGRRALVDRCANHPLWRALRPGRLVLGALQDTLLAHLARDLDRMPFWQLATAPLASLEARAAAIAAASALEAVPTAAVVGGGAVPERTIPSAGVRRRGDTSAPLRAFEPAVIARVEDGWTVLDLRTVSPADDAVVVKALAATAREGIDPPTRAR